MYQCIKQAFGAWEALNIVDPKSGNGFAVVPAMGANLLSLNFLHQNIIDGFKSPEALASGDWSKSAVLFPFPNRLNDGIYKLNGKTYQFPINDEQGQNALHGLDSQKRFDVQEILLEEDRARLSLSYADQGNDPAYPFPFTIQIHFSINTANEFEVELSMTNLTNHPIPAGLGWHPYFNLADTIDQCSLQVPEAYKIEVDQQMIPTGKKTNYEDFLIPTKIEQTELDTCFELKDKNGRASISLIGENAQIIYWQEAAPQAWNFFQIFTPPHRKSIAIEPMSCNIDAFNNQDGLVLLAPQQSFGGKFGISYAKK